MLVSNTCTKYHLCYITSMIVSAEELTHVRCSAARVRSVCSLSHHSAVKHTPQHVQGC